MNINHKLHINSFERKKFNNKKKMIVVIFAIWCNVIICGYRIIATVLHFVAEQEKKAVIIRPSSEIIGNARLFLFNVFDMISFNVICCLYELLCGLHIIMCSLIFSSLLFFTCKWFNFKYISCSMKLKFVLTFYNFAALSRGNIWEVRHHSTAWNRFKSLVRHFIQRSKLKM